MLDMARTTWGWNEEARHQPQQVLGRVEGPQRLVDVRDGGQRLVGVAGLAHGHLGQVEVGGSQGNGHAPRFAGWQRDGLILSTVP